MSVVTLDPPSSNHSEHHFPIIFENGSDTSLNDSFDNINITTNNSIPQEWTNKQVALILILGGITLITIFSNGFVLYIFWMGKRRLRNPTNLLLANMAVADLLVGVCVMPFLSATTILGGKWIFGDLICECFDYVHFLLCGASMCSMIGVGVDRFIGVSRPLQYRNIMTRTRTTVLVGLIWLLAALLTSGPLTYWPKAMSGVATVCFVNLEKFFLVFVVFFVYWIPIAATVIVYCLIYRSAVAPFSKGTIKHSSSKKPDELENVSAAKSKQTRLAKSIAVITGMLFLFYAPVFLVFTIKAFELPYFSMDLLFLAAWVRYSCSTVNPFMYALAVPGYKQEIKERLFGIRKGGGKMEESIAPSYISSSGDDGHKKDNKKEIIEGKPQVVVGTMKLANNENRMNRYCTQCGFLMKNILAGKNVRCDKCNRQVLCASWMLPATWGSPSYFTCPMCPTIRFFDGAEPCFCQNCSHKFAPLESREPHEKVAALTTLTRKPTQRMSSSEKKETTDVKEKRTKAIEKLRNSVILPYLEERRSRMLFPNQNVEMEKVAAGASSNSISVEELEEIVAQLEHTFSKSIGGPQQK